MYFVYFLKSEEFEELYVGSTNDISRRLREHNGGFEKSTKRYMPWELVYFEAYKEEKLARLREKSLKSHGRALSEVKKRAGFFNYKSGAGFTLIEVLIVVGVIAVLAAVLFLVLNPVVMFQQGRDSNRLVEIESLDKALNLASTQNLELDMGLSNRVYVSLPSLDNDNDCLDDYPSLPVLLGGWQYFCAASSTYQRVDGTGWVPVDFSSLSNPPLNQLPVDPINTAESGFYYRYVPGWEIYANMESSRYASSGDRDKEGTDGGDSPVLYERGMAKNAAPVEVGSGTEYLVRVPVPSVGCSQLPSFPANNFSGSEYYSRWTIPGSGSVIATKVWAYFNSTGDFDSGESVEVAIYDDLSRALVSGITLVASTSSVDEWKFGYLNPPVTLNLGSTYIFGIGPKTVIDGYAFGSYSTVSCPGYLPNDPNPVMATQAAAGGLNGISPVPASVLTRRGIFGISYTQ